MRTKSIPLMTDEQQERFWSRVRKGLPYSCWLWQGATIKGYGMFSLQNGPFYAHRISYTLLVEAIPDGLQIDHLCLNPSCVNPMHLEVVTLNENRRRARTLYIPQRFDTHCNHGHELSEDNVTVYATKSGQYRACRICAARRQREYRARRKARLGE